MLLVSLGTGEQCRPLPWEKIKDWGLVEWAKPAFDVVFDGITDTAAFQAHHVLGPERCWRLQTELDKADDDIDDATAGNLELLAEEADELIRTESDTLDALAALLPRGGED